MRIVKSLVLCILFFQTSCYFFPRRMTVLPEYQGKRVKNVSLGIMPLRKDIRLRYDGTVRKALGEGKRLELITDYFTKRLPKAIQSGTTFDTAFFLNENQLFGVQETSWLAPDSAVFSFHLPDNSYVPDSSETGPDYILFLENLMIKTVMKYYSDMPGTGAQEQKQLAWLADCAIWDNRKGGLVFYGHVEERASNQLPEITLSTWDEVSMRFATRLVKHTPFAIPKKKLF